MSRVATPRCAASVGILLVSLLSARAEDPPPDLARRVALRATETRRARDQFTYRQTVSIEELTPAGARAGEYREVREVFFSPLAERSEQLVGKPLRTLQRLQLTDEDFRDIREVQPFLFDSDQLWFYETRFKGEETIDGVECWVLQVRPRQVLAGQRLFDGLLWASKKNYSIVRTEGKAVPEIRGTKDENLFPRFTTIWEPIDGDFRFPVHTYADDTLDFRVGPQRIRLTIRYSNYKRFAAKSTVKFGDPVAEPRP
ncbi:MAG: hypothetical protein ABSH05_19455 [Bryobacteraceae bacterium]|jgi:hypothetical protein